MANAQYIIDVDQNNVNDVLQMSTRIPVLLDFWAEWCEPCKALSPVLEKLAHEYQGRFILAKVDTEANTLLCQQLGIRSIPALKLIVQGQLAGELDGAQPESVIRSLLETAVGSPENNADDDALDSDDFFGQIQRARNMGAYEQAIEALQAAIKEQPKEISYQILLAEVLMDCERVTDAEDVLDSIDDESAKKGALNRLFFIKELAGFESQESLQFRLANNADDLEAKYYLAIHCVLAGEFEAGMELFISIVQQDRNFKADGAKDMLLKVFDMVPGDPLVSTYRRKLFACLH